MYFIGVDLGTSAVKLLLMQEDGQVLRVVSREYPLYFPHSGWSEQNPDDWFNQTMKGIGQLLEGFDKENVAGISFGGQMHGLVILDDQDRVIRPAILWNDGRTGEETDYLNQTVGKETLSRCTANIAFAGFTAPKILWVKNMNQNISRGFERSCCQRIIWLTVCPVLLHRFVRRFRHAASGCEKPLLVKGNAGSVSHHRRSAAKTVRKL